MQIEYKFLWPATALALRVHALRWFLANFDPICRIAYRLRRQLVIRVNQRRRSNCRRSLQRVRVRRPAARTGQHVIYCVESRRRLIKRLANVMQLSVRLGNCYITERSAKKN